MVRLGLATVILAASCAILVVSGGQASAASNCKKITSQSKCNAADTCTWHTRKGICVPR